MKSSEYDYQMEDPFLREQKEQEEEMRQYYEQIDDEMEVERNKQEHYEYMQKCSEIVEAMTLKAIDVLAQHDEDFYNAAINNSMHTFIDMIGLTRDDPRVVAQSAINLQYLQNACRQG